MKDIEVGDIVLFRVRTSQGRTEQVLVDRPAIVIERLYGDTLVVKPFLYPEDEGSSSPRPFEAKECHEPRPLTWHRRRD
jgi:hypothetical protein